MVIAKTNSCDVLSIFRIAPDQLGDVFRTQKKGKWKVEVVLVHIQLTLEVPLQSRAKK